MICRSLQKELKRLSYRHLNQGIRYDGFLDSPAGVLGKAVMNKETFIAKAQQIAHYPARRPATAVIETAVLQRMTRNNTVAVNDERYQVNLSVNPFNYISRFYDVFLRSVKQIP